MPGVLPQPKVAYNSPSPSPPNAPLMSAWPNPDHPTSPRAEAGVEEPHTGVNRAMAIRPSEHIRNSHDRTRSSIH